MATNSADRSFFLQPEYLLRGCYYTYKLKLQSHGVFSYDEFIPFVVSHVENILTAPVSTNEIPGRPSHDFNQLHLQTPALSSNTLSPRLMKPHQNIRNEEIRNETRPLDICVTEEILLPEVERTHDQTLSVGASHDAVQRWQSESFGYVSEIDACRTSIELNENRTPSVSHVIIDDCSSTSTVSTEPCIMDREACGGSRGCENNCFYGCVKCEGISDEFTVKLDREFCAVKEVKLGDECVIRPSLTTHGSTHNSDMSASGSIRSSVISNERGASQNNQNLRKSKRGRPKNREVLQTANIPRTLLHQSASLLQDVSTDIVQRSRGHGHSEDVNNSQAVGVEITPNNVTSGVPSIENTSGVPSIENVRRVLPCVCKGGCDGKCQIHETNALGDGGNENMDTAESADNPDKLAQSSREGISDVTEQDNLSQRVVEANEMELVSSNDSVQMYSKRNPTRKRGRPKVAARRRVTNKKSNQTVSQPSVPTDFGQSKTSNLLENGSGAATMGNASISFCTRRSPRKLQRLQPDDNSLPNGEVQSEHRSPPFIQTDIMATRELNKGVEYSHPEVDRSSPKAVFQQSSNISADDGVLSSNPRDENSNVRSNNNSVDRRRSPRKKSCDCKSGNSPSADSRNLEGAAITCSLGLSSTEEASQQKNKTSTDDENCSSSKDKENDIDLDTIEVCTVNENTSGAQNSTSSLFDKDEAVSGVNEVSADENALSGCKNLNLGSSCTAKDYNNVAPVDAKGSVADSEHEVTGTSADYIEDKVNSEDKDCGASSSGFTNEIVKENGKSSHMNEGSVTPPELCGDEGLNSVTRGTEDDNAQNRHSSTSTVKLLVEVGRTHPSDSQLVNSIGIVKEQNSRVSPTEVISVSVTERELDKSLEDFSEPFNSEPPVNAFRNLFSSLRGALQAKLSGLPLSDIQPNAEGITRTCFSRAPYIPVTRLQSTPSKRGKYYVCEVCNRVFRIRHHLRLHKGVHMTKNGKRPFACDACPRSYSAKQALRFHIKVFHNGGNKHFKCSVSECAFTSDRRLSVQKHEQAVHKIMYSDIKKYRCKYCDKQFVYKQSCNLHQRSHTGEKPFPCKLCGRRFADSSTSNKHLQRVHYKTRPLECHLCGKSYVSNSDLARHLGIHAGRRPFGCEQCSMKFTQKAHLKKHMRCIHNVNANR